MDVETAMRDDPNWPANSRVAFRCIPHNRQSAELSLRVKCRINGIKQSRVAEWLEQTLHRTQFE
jgi:hypothetical protein